MHKLRAMVAMLTHRGREDDKALAAEKARADKLEADCAAMRAYLTSPPVYWITSADRTSMQGDCDCGQAMLSVDGRVEVRCLKTNTLLARIDTHAHDGDVPGVLQDRWESQREIAAALLWSHRRSHAPAATSPGAGWVSPEEHARALETAWRAAKDAFVKIEADRDAALAVKAQLLVALEDARAALRQPDGRRLCEDHMYSAAIDAALAAAKGGAT
jgi:hypothetical protein